MYGFLKPNVKVNFIGFVPFLIKKNKKVIKKPIPNLISATDIIECSSIIGRTIKTEIAVNNCANKPNKTALKTCFFVIPEIFSAVPIIIAQLIRIAPIKTYFVITSLNKINAKNIMAGAYAVAIIAERAEINSTGYLLIID